MDPCLPVDPPFLCGRLPAPCPVVPVALCYRCLSSACVLVPELRELVLRTCCLAVDAFGCAAATKWRLRRCLVMLPRLPVSYTHLRAHETDSYLVCRLLLE